MDILCQTRQALARFCTEQRLDQGKAIVVRQLSADDAIGSRASNQFPVKRGKERVLEAVFDEGRGQAFTDQPQHWSGTFAEMLLLDLSNVGNRAVFVAGMNAVLRAHGKAVGTVHCKNEDPEGCGPVIAERLQRDYGSVHIGLIGLQPAIMAALVQRFGADCVHVTDLNPDNIGKERAGVLVWDGAADLARLVEWCDVGLATGSSIVNGTIDDIVDRFQAACKRLVFFGNTISGAAALLGLRRMCPFGR